MQTTTFYRNSETFWDRIAPRYVRKPVSDPVAYDEKISTVRRLLKASDRVLEIGCGTGSTALRLASSVSFIMATDISARMIEFAQAKLRAGGPANVNFHQADATEMIEGGPFDAVCAFSLLHLVEDIPLVLASVRQQLKPGGLFISKTVCLEDGPLPVRVFVRTLAAVGIAPRVVMLSKARLIQQLQDAGFEVETSSHFGRQRRSPFIVARRSSSETRYAKQETWNDQK